MGARIAVPAAIALWAGLLASRVAFARGAGESPAFLAIALTLSALAILLAWRTPGRGRAVALLAAFLLAGAARGLAFRERLAVARAPLRSSEIFWIDGMIAEPPALESGAPLAVIAVRAARPALVTGSRVRLRLPEGCQAEWGDRLRVLARLSVSEPPRNPGGFDLRATAEAASLIGGGVALVANVRRARGLEAWPRATVMRWRRSIEGVLHRSLSAGAVELVVPLVFGDRSAIDTDLDAAFRAAGLTHLLALSGLHVAWLAGMARTCAAALGAGVRGRAIARGLCGALYLLLAGPIPSLARAALGEMLMALARLSQRALDPVQALAVAAIALLTMSPGWAVDLGFQLSCAATVGLVTVGAWLGGARGIARPLARSLGPTASAQLVSLPLLLSRFHALAWTAGLSNLVAVPATGLLLTAAWLGALVDLAVPGAGAPFLHACEPLAWMLRAIVECAERFPGALLATGAGDAPAWLAAAGALLLAIALSPVRDLEARSRGAPPARDAAIVAGIALTLASLAIAVGTAPLIPPRAHTWIVVLDVGQGDAIALGTARGWWLVDAGPRTPHTDAGQAVVLPFLRWAGVRGLRALMLTHDDGDHTGGARAVLRGTRVARLLAPAPRPGVPGPLARFHGEPLALGAVIDPAPGMIVRWPPRPDSATAFWERPVTSADNGCALVIELGAGAGRALLTADADSAVEAALGVAPGLALLKVGHHGSGSSSGARFLNAVRPRFAAISVGRRNRFGHPDPGALARLAAAGATILRTDQSGALWFELGADGARPIDWRHGEWRSREPELPPRVRPSPRE